VEAEGGGLLSKMYCALAEPRPCVAAVGQFDLWPCIPHFATEKCMAALEGRCPFILCALLPTLLGILGR